MGYKDLANNQEDISYKTITENELEKLRKYEQKRMQKLQKIKNNEPDLYEIVVQELKDFVIDKKLEIRRKEEKVLKKIQQNKDKYEKISKEEIRCLSKSLSDAGNPFYNYQMSYYKDIELAVNKQVTVATFEEAETVIGTIDIKFFLGIKSKYFDCQIINGNIASINVDKEGHYRYFTKVKGANIGKVLDLIDLIQIINNIGYYEAVRIICVIADINVIEGEWTNLERQKYADNIDKIQNADILISQGFPKLYKYIYKYAYLLEELNQIAMGLIGSQKESIDGECIFFTSSRYIEKCLIEKGIKKDHTTIDRLINMFAALGIIKKIPSTQLPKHLLNRAVEAKNSNPGYKHIATFYIIPKINHELLTEAQKRVTKLINAGIAPTKINSKEDNIRKVLGLKVYRVVFGDTGDLAKAIVKKRNKNKMEVEQKKEKEVMEEKYISRQLNLQVFEMNKKQGEDTEEDDDEIPF